MNKHNYGREIIADLKFILWHRETKTEIEMPVLSICEEYSNIAFGTKEGAYNDDYNGIGRLPSYTANDTADEYDVYVEINGVRHLYDGLFYNSDYTETKRKTKALNIADVSQQREILKAYAELIQKYYTNNFFDDAIEESIGQFLKIIECKICKDTGFKKVGETDKKITIARCDCSK